MRHAWLLVAALLGGCSLDSSGPLFNPDGEEATGAGTTSGDPSGSSGETGGGHTTGPGAGGGTSSGPTTGAGGGTTSGGGGSNPGGMCGNGGPPSDPKCYWEDVCPDASLDDLVQAYTPNGWLSTSIEMMKRRYPSASCLIDMYQNDVGNYADAGSFASLAESSMTMVHEETHGYDYEHASGGNFAYYIRCDLSMTTPWLDSFPRSEIYASVAAGSGTDLYDGTYLTGEQGTYGFVELLDEWNAYLNGMAAIGLVGDHVDAFGISGTDGAVAFAYYVELYLGVARTQHPTTYAAIKNDPAFVELLRVEWNRLHFFLALAEKYSNLSIEAATIKQQLYAPENQNELELVLGGPISASNCN